MIRLDRWNRPVKFTHRCKICQKVIPYMQLRTHCIIHHYIDIKTTVNHYDTEKYYEVEINDLR